MAAHLHAGSPSELKERLEVERRGDFAPQQLALWWLLSGLADELTDAGAPGWTPR